MTINIVIGAVQRWTWTMKWNEGEMGMKEAIIQYNDLPSGGHMAISWIPLVRCKDCKHWWYGNYCDKHGKGQENADWYCADGERRTDDA